MGKGQERLLSSFYNLIYPPICLLCRKRSQEPVCGNCLERLTFIETFCWKCGKPTNWSVEECSFCRGRRLHFFSRSLFVYEGEVKELVHLFKYHFHRALAEFFSRLILEKYADFLKDVEIVTFVPMYSRKLWLRGYNQSHLLARGISQGLGCNFLDALIVQRRLEDQVKLGREERKKNVKGAYRVKERAARVLKGKIILLVDDVFTTGSTVEECAHIFYRAGAKRTKVVSIARRS